MKRLMASTAAIALGLILGFLIPARTIAQTGVLLFGSNAGAPQPIKATAGALFVALQSTAAGGGTDTILPSGILSYQRTTTDNATLNTWNVISSPVSASTLNNNNGQTLRFVVGLLGANNVNTHEYQAYFADTSSTCGGTGAALCTTGCLVLPSVTNTTAFAQERLEVEIPRVSSGNQDFVRALTGSINQAWAVGTCTLTDTNATKLVFGTRNTSAGAASLAQVDAWVYFSAR